ncbi:uncharacterized protein CDV56_100941 [Aspergillus thermomutatus]|uniref:Uncharacterized protein n=1 Tax=Aspergillus thermomutatus TaxID=41047 RepID=A0A397G1N2_ASPTH|nr:uncharacterized protein CDV56_100941 [Aspergillus thermomutatus]RHZ43206.1 hypothetical protein CDV56_100941 [Aspergillus thermomutatus]
MLQAWDQAQAQTNAHRTAQASELTDANPWLWMTGWPDYLTGITEKDMRDCVAAPEEDVMDATEQRVQLIWNTMEQVAQKSQQIVQQCGQAIRMKAVRSQKGQMPYRPLLAYMDATAIKRHVHLWQQILAFIARTQAPHDWTSPKYGMTRHHSQEYESALVCAMAVLGQGETGWRDPESYPLILSQVIKIARFMVVQKALWMDPNPSEIIQIWGRKDASAEWVLSSADDSLGEINEGYDSNYATAVQSSPPSPIHSDDALPAVDMHWQGRQLFQELKVHYNTTAPGHVMWMGEDQLLYQQMQFTMGDFQGFIHGLMPPIPWTALYDDPSQSQRRWNFLQDARTQWPVDGPRWMIDRVRAEPTVQREFMRGGRFHSPAIRQYWQCVAQFKEKLAVLVHITTGAPARAPELLSIQHSNTANSMRRNIYIEEGMVTFVTAYHKGFHASNDVKIIHRYVQREVGELVVWYMWTVAHTAWLWGPDPGTGREWSSERFQEGLKRETRT